VCKRAGFLYPNRLPELVWDSESKKQGLPAIYEDKGGFQDEPRVSHLKLDPPNILLIIVQQLDIVKCIMKRKFFGVGQV
jgi:hypothetical protein